MSDASALLTMYSTDYWPPKDRSIHGHPAPQGRVCRKHRQIQREASTWQVLEDLLSLTSKQMWWHADAPNRAYNWLLQGHAVSDTIEGPYTYVDAFQPLGNWSQDFGLFTDPHTKTSYALYSNGDRREARDVYPTSYNEDLDTTRWFSGFKIQLEIESAIMNYISNF